MNVENNQFPEVLIKEFCDSFAYRIDKEKKISPTRVRLNGKFITTDSGKTIWNSRGAAQSALLNHIEGNGYGWMKLLQKYKTLKEGENDLKASWHSFIDYLIKSGILQFVQVSSTQTVIRNK